MQWRAEPWKSTCTEPMPRRGGCHQRYQHDESVCDRRVSLYIIIGLSAGRKYGFSRIRCLVSVHHNRPQSERKHFRWTHHPECRTLRRNQLRQSHPQRLCHWSGRHPEYYLRRSGTRNIFPTGKRGLSNRPMHVYALLTKQLRLCRMCHTKRIDC